MALVLDTGGLIGFERGDRKVAALIEATRRRREQIVTSSGCVAQTWRVGGSPRALLARLLRGVLEQGLDREVSRRVGQLCGEAALNDIVDAHVAVLAHDDDVVLTGDVGDLRRLLRARGSRADVRRC